MRGSRAERGLACGEWLGRAEAEPADLDWLLEFLTPWFTCVDAAGQRVRLLRDDRGTSEAASGADSASLVPAFELDQQTTHLPVREGIDGRFAATDDQYGVAYLLTRDRQHIDIVAATRNIGARTAFMRVVREAAMIDARRAGHLLLHAAAAVHRDGAVLLAGRKGSGKTSLLIHLLQRGDAALLSNDRVIISMAEPGPIARGIPTVIGLDEAAQRRFPGLGRRVQAERYDHRRRLTEPGAERRPRPRYTLSPAQLCAALGVRAEPSAPLRAIMFPTVRSTEGPLRLRRLTEAEAHAHLTAALFGSPPFRPTELFAPSPSPNASADPAALQRALAQAVPCFACELGAEAYGSDRPLAQLLAETGAS